MSEALRLKLTSGEVFDSLVDHISTKLPLDLKQLLIEKVLDQVAEIVFYEIGPEQLVEGSCSHALYVRGAQIFASKETLNEVEEEGLFI